MALTCRQLYAETALLPYQNCVFHFYTSDYLYKWLKVLPQSKKKAVRELKLNFHPNAWVEEEIPSLIPIYAALPNLRRVSCYYRNTHAHDVRAKLPQLEAVLQSLRQDGRLAELVME